MKNPVLRFARLLGARYRGLRGLDLFLRCLHSPDHRKQSWVEGWYAAKWGGPQFYLDTRFFVEWGCLFYGSQDDRLHTLIRERVRPDWIGLDIGANFGFYSVLLASYAPQGMVHSFEPVDWLGERLMRNARHNGVEARIRLNQVALSAENGTANLVLPGRNDANQGTASLVRAAAGAGRTVAVRTQRLDDYVSERKIDRIDFIKIDVEGAEALVIEGAMETLARTSPLIVVERNESSDARVCELLSTFGYVAAPVPRLRSSRLFREEDTDVLYSKTPR